MVETAAKLALPADGAAASVWPLVFEQATAIKAAAGISNLFKKFNLFKRLVYLPY